ncbi:MAG: hypothetical protein CL678_09785, partial [Bdellovibrionaceae bacterium]|nr:hypothetical protein [Pseudobdellovibrionaceae bacterium]
NECNVIYNEFLDLKTNVQKLTKSKNSKKDYKIVKQKSKELQKTLDDSETALKKHLKDIELINREIDSKKEKNPKKIVQLTEKKNQILNQTLMKILLEITNKDTIKEYSFFDQGHNLNSVCLGVQSEDSIQAIESICLTSTELGVMLAITNKTTLPDSKNLLRVHASLSIDTQRKSQKFVNISAINSENEFNTSEKYTPHIEYHESGINRELKPQIIAVDCTPPKEAKTGVGYGCKEITNYNIRLIANTNESLGFSTYTKIKERQECEKYPELVKKMTHLSNVIEPGLSNKVSPKKEESSSTVRHEEILNYRSNSAK